MGPIGVFIVDDSAAVRDGLESILSAHDDLHVVGTAGNGVEAVERAAALHPDIILMDAQMPVMDGAEATRIIKRNGANTKVLFLTVHPSYLQEGLDAGADAALLKDLDRQELVAAVRNLAAS